MKLPFETLAAVVVLFGMCAGACAQVSPVNMRVEQVSSTDPDKTKSTQNRSLKVHLTNSSATDHSGLKVRFWWFARDVKDRDVSVAEKGEAVADVKARSTQVVETGSVSAMYTKEHMKGGGNRNGRGNAKPGKKVEAEGKKLVGYAVQLWTAEKMLAAQYSEPSFKALVEKAK